jgi:hypothetical protein
MASAITTKQPVMSLEELQTTAAWNICTPRQRMWLQGFIQSNGDADFATRSSYNSKDERYLAMLSHQIRKNQNTRAALRLFYGTEADYLDTQISNEQVERDERDRFFRRIQRRIGKGKLSIADVEAIKMVCREKGWTVPENLPPGRNGYVPKAQRHFVGEVFRQNSKPYRATRVDASGASILDADEISEEEFDRLKREQSR